ncbi:MAG: BREX-1 system phosphatase PglZ type B, partial [Thermomicrobiales bacterium]
MVSNAHMQTVLDALLQSLATANRYNQDAEVSPLAILWPDGNQQWERVMPSLRDRLPILTLGDFDADARTGPAIWIRAELATREPGDATPIIYLPGISKNVFRNVEDAPEIIQPLLYLQYRGSMFHQPNGKDWTIPAFLRNAQHGLDIKVDGSEATRTALVSAAPLLLQRRVSDLRNHPGGIDADYLSTLLISDIPKRILQWINDPAATRTALDGAAWTAFSQQLRTKYRLDPERDGASEAARLLGSAEPGSYWVDVWNRFAESPASYTAIPAMLRGAKPGETGQRGLFGSAESHFHWPQDNEEEETSLRQALAQLVPNAVAAARATILDLDARHAPRRACVWATLEQSPLASALQHLAILARDTAVPFAAGDVQTMQDHYTASGWQIDIAALDALREVTTADDRTAIEHALDAIYTPWLWATAEKFQQAMSERKVSSHPSPIAPPPGTCVLFADGLRYDLGARLTEMLRTAGHKTEISGTVGPLPGVTPSAKPAQSPVADLLVAGPKLNVCVAPSGSVMNQVTLKKLLAEKSWDFLTPGDAGAPDGMTKAWTELGNIDSYGHNHSQ